MQMVVEETSGKTALRQYPMLRYRLNSAVYTYRPRLFLTAVMFIVSVQGRSIISSLFLAARREEAKASFPLPLPGPRRSQGAALSDRLAASRDYNHRDLLWAPCKWAPSLLAYMSLFSLT